MTYSEIRELEKVLIYIRGLLCPADYQRYELIDGVLYDMAAPAVTHQEIAFEIAVALRIRADV